MNRSVLIIATSVLLPFGDLAQCSGPGDELNGDWEAVSMTGKGQPIGDNIVRDTKMEIRGVKGRLYWNNTVVEWSIATDTTTTPKTIDIVGVSGGIAGRKMMGIYQIDGDQLTICTHPSGTARPTAFSSTARNEQSIIVYKRVNPKGP